MPLTEIKWQNLKEDLLTNVAEKLSNSKTKLLKETINLLLLSTKRELTLYVLRCLLRQESLPSDVPKEEIWKESFWPVEEQLLTQLKS